MAKLAKFLQGVAGVGGAGLNVEEVFSTYLYDGSSSAQTITNGIDLSGEGGLVWIKSRTSTTTAFIYDTERGATKGLTPSETGAQETDVNTLTAFNSNAFSVGSSGKVNSSLNDYASWTFRKAPKFFDVVTYTGNNTNGRTISHNLGSVPGMILIKCTSLNSTSWIVWHRSLTNANYYMSFNTSDPESNGGGTFPFNGTAPTDSVFSVADGNSNRVNASGATYVAYLFAHNDGDGTFGPTGDQDIIKCGSFTGSSSGALINLGFEPQWVMWKKINSAGSWFIADSMRFFTSKPPNNGQVKDLKAESSAAEVGPNYYIGLDSQGFWEDGLGTSDSYIYIAIRKGPMAVPTAATDVFDVRAGFTGTDRPQFPSGFVTDMGLLLRTSGANPRTSARLIQGQMLKTNLTDAETANSAYVFDYQNGWLDSGLDTTYYGYSWKRAPNYFDVVAYTGDGVVGRTVSHNLGVAPEMIWVKRRDGLRDWYVYHSALGNTGRIKLNTTDAVATGFGDWGSTDPTSSVFSVGGGTNTNGNGNTYIAYLFASLDGVSKVGSFTYSGTTLNVDCGFSNGARFVLYKRYNTTGSWLVLDTERGINASANDPVLYLNATDAEDSGYNLIEPYSAGFTISGNDVGNGDYIFYAIA